MNTLPSSVEMPKAEKIKAWAMIVLLLFFFVYLLSRLDETSKSQTLLLGGLLSLAFYKNGLRLWFSQVKCHADELHLNSSLGITKIALASVTRIKLHPQTKGWLNPKHGYFVVETSQNNKRHYVVALSHRNKNDLEQFFAGHFPEQYQAIDPLVASLSP